MNKHITIMQQHYYNLTPMQNDTLHVCDIRNHRANGVCLSHSPLFG
jgi:hypothetical protein